MSSSSSEDFSSSSEDSGPDYFSQVCLLGPIFKASGVTISVVVDLCVPDALFVGAAPVQSIDPSGVFNGVEVSGVAQELRNNAYIKASFTPVDPPTDAAVIQLWSDSIVTKVVEALALVRAYGATRVVIDPDSVEVF